MLIASHEKTLLLDQPRRIAAFGRNPDGIRDNGHFSKNAAGLLLGEPTKFFYFDSVKCNGGEFPTLHPRARRLCILLIHRCTLLDCTSEASGNGTLPLGREGIRRRHCYLKSLRCSRRATSGCGRRSQRDRLERMPVEHVFLPALHGCLHEVVLVAVEQWNDRQLLDQHRVHRL